ncbi:MAG: hypothetical protein A2X94_12380 [Bdellovibrionales bacterium GWB1_55_8]|nr:MAG: hypothetical protein A2X94_12380 [Bdellovibrionales bacterium GWB1_55_8]
MKNGAEITEAEFRNLAQEVFKRIDRGFGGIDPDVAECEWSQGALVIQFAGGSRTVLSMQPAVRQIWIAMGAKGRAYHFNWNLDARVWVDPDHAAKAAGGGAELFDIFREHMRELTGLDFDLK